MDGPICFRSNWNGFNRQSIALSSVHILNIGCAKNIEKKVGCEGLYNRVGVNFLSCFLLLLVIQICLPTFGPIVLNLFFQGFIG